MPLETYFIVDVARSWVLEIGLSCAGEVWTLSFSVAILLAISGIVLMKRKIESRCCNISRDGPVDYRSSVQARVSLATMPFWSRTDLSIITYKIKIKHWYS